MKYFFIVSLLLTLYSCGGGGNSSSTPATPPPTESTIEKLLVVKKDNGKESLFKITNEEMVEIKEFNAVDSYIITEHIYEVGNKKYFFAVHDGSVGLWKTDGTESGTVLLQSSTSTAHPYTSHVVFVGENKMIFQLYAEDQFTSHLYGIDSSNDSITLIGKFLFHGSQFKINSENHGDQLGFNPITNEVFGFFIDQPLVDNQPYSRSMLRISLNDFSYQEVNYPSGELNEMGHQKFLWCNNTMYLNSYYKLWQVNSNTLERSPFDFESDGNLVVSSFSDQYCFNDKLYGNGRVGLVSDGKYNEVEIDLLFSVNFNSFPQVEYYKLSPEVDRGENYSPQTLNFDESSNIAYFMGYLDHNDRQLFSFNLETKNFTVSEDISQIDLIRHETNKDIYLTYSNETDTYELRDGNVVVKTWGSEVDYVDSLFHIGDNLFILYTVESDLLKVRLMKLNDNSFEEVKLLATLSDMIRS